MRGCGFDLITSILPTPSCALHGAGGRTDRGEHDDGVGSLGDGLGAAVLVEVGGGEAGVGAVDADVGKREHVLEGEHVHRGLGCL